MLRDNCKNINNRNQGYVASPECNLSTISSPGYTITLEKQDSNLKSLLMMIEDFKKDINNSHKEIQENTVNSWKLRTQRG